MKKTLNRICAGLALPVLGPTTALADEPRLSNLLDKDYLLLLIILFALLAFSYVSHEGRGTSNKKKG